MVGKRSLLAKHAKTWSELMPDDPTEQPTAAHLRTTLDVLGGMTRLRKSPKRSREADRHAARLNTALNKLNRSAKKLMGSRAGAGLPTQRSPVAGMAGRDRVRVRNVAKNDATY